MAINKLSPTTFTTVVLIGDAGNATSVDALPVLTTVGNPAIPIAAALEIQSTIGAFVPPRMTTAQKLALTPLVNGAQVFDTTLNAEQTLINGVWSTANSAIGIQTATGTFTAAQFDAMHSAAIPIVPAPGVGFVIVPEAFALNLVSTGTIFAGGGSTYLSNVTNGADNMGAFLTAASFYQTVNFYYTLNLFQIPGIVSTAFNNQPLVLTNNNANFTGGGTATFNWTLFYRILPIV